MVDEVVQDNGVNLSDIIKEQSNTIETLVNKIETGEVDSGTQIQPIYQTTPEKTAAKPNYVLYIGIGIALWFLLKRRK